MEKGNKSREGEAGGGGAVYDNIATCDGSHHLCIVLFATQYWNLPTDSEQAKCLICSCLRSVQSPASAASHSLVVCCPVVFEVSILHGSIAHDAGTGFQLFSSDVIPSPLLDSAFTLGLRLI